MAELNFDATKVPKSDFDIIPAGRYEATIIDSEQRENAAGTGWYLLLTFQITRGEHAGRMLFERLNLNNPSDKAVGAARSRLAAICHAIGVLTPKDSRELHGLPLIVSVRVKTRADNGEPGNEVGVCQPLVRGKTATQGSADKPETSAASTRAPW